MPEAKHFIVRTPLFPLYSEVQLLTKILAGMPKDGVWGMIKALFDQTGTPQANVDWSQPNEWIDQRLQQPGTVFMAVGAGHLAGENSVQDYLVQQNIAATR